MTSRSRSFAASSRWLVPALGLTLALVAGVGCSSRPKPTPEQTTKADVAQYEAQIRKVIPDSARADKAVGLTNEIQKLVQETVASAKDYRAKVAAAKSNVPRSP